MTEYERALLLLVSMNLAAELEEAGKGEDADAIYDLVESVAEEAKLGPINGRQQPIEES
jgi:hypothetical protein